MRQYRRKQRAKIPQKGIQRRTRLKVMIQVKQFDLTALDAIDRKIILLWLDGLKLKNITPKVGVDVATVSRRIKKIECQVEAQTFAGQGMQESFKK